MTTTEPRPVWVGISDGPSGVFVVGIWPDADTAKAETRAVADPDATLAAWREDGAGGWVADSDHDESAMFVQAANPA